MRKTITIILPAYNEATFLRRVVLYLHQHSLFRNKTRFLIVENGSTDGTKQIALSLSKKYPDVSTICLSKANYGLSLKTGIIHAKTDILIIFNVDYFDINFSRKALTMIHSYDIIAGSKLHPNTHDKRPIVRRLISKILHTMLTIFFHYQGPDTHGLKLLRRSKVLPIVRQCQDYHELFDTELMLRGMRSGLRVGEIGVTVWEQRTSVSSLRERLPRALYEFLHLWMGMRGF